VDSARFGRLVAAARTRLDEVPLDAADLLDQALALRHGQPFGEFSTEEFACTEVAPLEELRRATTVDQGLALPSARGQAIQAVPPQRFEHRVTATCRKTRSLPRCSGTVPPTHCSHRSSSATPPAPRWLVSDMFDVSTVYTYDSLDVAN
jgi:hypothetical protein